MAVNQGGRERRDWREAQKNIEFDFYASKAITKDRQLDGFEDRGRQGLRKRGKEEKERHSGRMKERT